MSSPCLDRALFLKFRTDRSALRALVSEIHMVVMRQLFQGYLITYSSRERSEQLRFSSPIFVSDVVKETVAVATKALLTN
eukprot:scaffold22403_cov108-Skeletonema_menzelii.AAC.1